MFVDIYGIEQKQDGDWIIGRGSLHCAHGQNKHCYPRIKFRHLPIKTTQFRWIDTHTHTYTHRDRHQDSQKFLAGILFWQLLIQMKILFFSQSFATQTFEFGQICDLLELIFKAFFGNFGVQGNGQNLIWYVQLLFCKFSSTVNFNFGLILGVVLG